MIRKLLRVSTGLLETRSAVLLCLLLPLESQPNQRNERHPATNRTRGASQTGTWHAAAPCLDDGLPDAHGMLARARDQAFAPLCSCSCKPSAAEDPPSAAKEGSFHDAVARALRRKASSGWLANPMRSYKRPLHHRLVETKDCLLPGSVPAELLDICRVSCLNSMTATLTWTWFRPHALSRGYM